MSAARVTDNRAATGAWIVLRVDDDVEVVAVGALDQDDVDSSLASLVTLNSVTARHDATSLLSIDGGRVIGARFYGADPDRMWRMFLMIEPRALIAIDVDVYRQLSRRLAAPKE